MQSLIGWPSIRLLKRTKLAEPRKQYPEEWFSKIVNQTLEKIISGGKNKLRATPKEHQKARLNLMINQLYFYNTEATLLKTLQANLRTYANCKWFL